MDGGKDAPHDGRTAGNTRPVRTGGQRRLDVDARRARGQSETREQRYAMDGGVRYRNPGRPSLARWLTPEF